MAPSRRFPAGIRLLLQIVALFSLVILPIRADDQYIYGTDGNGVTRELAVNRYPALYTGDFGDCLGGESLFNITKFDAAYYADNLTIVFHLDGTSNIKNESLMMHISVEAYGSSRFDMTFDPCFVNIYSLCPLNASVPITGWAIFQVGQAQIGGIPELAFSIPDFEGSTKLQIFANSSRTEIGCFQAVMRNGNSFAQPAAVAPVLGVFTLVAIVSSFLTAAYGVSVPHMRMHYAHSLPVLLVFETFHTIFFSGVLAVKWPSILIGWWSNFAWSAGMIYSSQMVHSIDAISGVSGNASQVGGAGSVVINNGGGLIGQIYGRSLGVASAARRIASRAPYNASDPYDYTWAGNPVTPGMPLPGTWNGFPGDLSVIGIPSADAFLVGLIWLIVALSLVALCVTALKFSLEGLARTKKIKEDRLGYFRQHWIRFLSLGLSRTLFMAFFMMMTLAMFQFAIQGPAGPTALAAITFICLLVGFGGLAAHAIRTRTRLGKFHFRSDEVIFHHAKLFKHIPVITATRASVISERELEVEAIAGVPVIRIQHLNDKGDVKTVHEDPTWIRRFGWLASRYRRTRWWFFAYYLAYQFIRACFVGGAVNSPLAQVYGLLIFEILAFFILIHLNPFEGARNTALGVWMLSIVKILTTGLSIAFLPGFNLDRIAATVLGVVIIVIQALLVLALMILIVLGAISSWMSLTRNHEDFEPEWMDSVRVRFFEKMELRAPDKWIPPPKSDKAKGKEKEGGDGTAAGEGGGQGGDATPEEPPQPYFSVNSVRRAPKIEDEDEDVVADLEGPSLIADTSAAARTVNRASRTNSVSSRYSVSSLPRAARAHRASWSSKDFSVWEQERAESRAESGLVQRLSSPGPLNAAIVAAANTGAGTGSGTANRTSAAASTNPKASTSADTSADASADVSTAVSADASTGPSGSASASSSRPTLVINPQAATAAAAAATAGSSSASLKNLSPTGIGSRPATPLSPVKVIETPSRETLAKHASERQFATPQPPADIH